VAWLQTIYGFKDKNVDYDAGKTNPSLRADGNLVQQTLSFVDPTNITVSTNTVDWNTKDGWYVDLSLNLGERVNVDPRLILGTLVLVSNVPSSGGSCSIGGSSFEYNFDYSSGSIVPNSGATTVGRSLGGTIAVGMAIVELPSGAIKDIITGADTSKSTQDVSINSASSSFSRFSYRER
jgi:type IV pilus assembly protein PilY1